MYHPSIGINGAPRDGRLGEVLQHSSPPSGPETGTAYGIVVEALEGFP
jgi:hypothetical protein